MIAGGAPAGVRRPLTNPATGAPIGTVVEMSADQAPKVMQAAVAGFRPWDRTPVSHRAATLSRAADALLAERAVLLALLQREAGKTLDDALAELREAVDFCRYYAAEAERELATPTVLPGPTGEDNRLSHRGRGVIIAISPWNFPLAIFIGQVAAALVAGNSVVAKPAEQTPLIAAVAVGILHRAGVPASALQLALGDGRVGAALVADPAVAGVVFTGSTETAWRINRALAEKSGPIVPLIAETGGLNAMIVDATALPEQVADDVVLSAFRSAGQRCSALRLLCLQDDIADHTLDLITGAAAELSIGDPADIATHIGPVIDADAKAAIDRAIAAARGAGRLLWQAPAPTTGHFVGPAIIRVDRVADLAAEVFGPVLYVLRWRASDLEALIDQVASTGYGLTLGVHSRIAATVEAVVQRVQVGNIYVNRSMIGAVVGTQPFGGSGLSGTGPKAGGPHYLMRFVLEQVVTTNTAAAGGNATLLAETDD
jgi:RHH-type proline utilization regulon transcriptional repressor/proline dehydrogenase/delta 1-pyrroline-5-carboxylate dehydrogenase